MPAIPAKKWLQIRTAYIVGGVSARKLAEMHGVNSVTIRTRASAEGWTAERDQHLSLAQMSDEEMSEKFRASASTISDILLEETRAALAQHVSLADRLVAAVEASLDGVEQIKAGRSKAEALRAYADAAAKAIGISREVRGLRPGDRSIASGEQPQMLRVVVAERPVDDAIEESATG